MTGTVSGDGVVLSSSKGECAIVNGVLSCASSVGSATVFGVSAGMLTFEGATDFYASAAPTGSSQAEVEVAEDEVTLQILWVAK